MNEKAVCWACEQHLVRQPHPDYPAPAANPDNYSSPTDQLRLALEMLQYEEILEVTGQGLRPDRQRQKQQRHPQPQRPDDPVHR